MAVMEDDESSSSSSSKAGGYYLGKCVLRGSAVLQVLQAHVRSPDSYDIVFAKEASIELVRIDQQGVVESICEQPVFGTIKDIAVLPSENKDLLLVISDSGKLSFLTFSNEINRFFALTHVQLSDPGNPRHQVGRMLAVDSSGQFIAACAYEDQLAMFSVATPAEGDIIDKKVYYPSECDANVSSDVGQISICGTIWSMCFLSRDFSDPSKEHNPLLAILLNRRGSFMNELLLLEWRTMEDSVQIRCQYAEAGPLAHSVVAVPHAHGFAFLFRIGDALLMDLRDAENPSCVYRMALNCLPTAVGEHNLAEESCRVHDPDEDGMFNVAASALLELCDLIKDDDPMSIDEEYRYFHSTSKHVCSWSWEPNNTQTPRLIFCLDGGDFFMIEISYGSDGLKVDLSECIYKGLPCKQLLWVESGFLAAIVEMGDGVVLKLEDGRLSHKNSIQNIAPILDMSVVDYLDEKHDQMFACCGMAPEGSLRIIRSGISVEKLLRTAPTYQGITGTWTMKMEEEDIFHSFLVLSFVEQTRVLSVGLSFTDVTDMVGFQPGVCTLACGVLGDGLLVQICQNAVNLCFPTTAAHPKGVSASSPICTSWSPDNVSISLGAVGSNMIAVATSSPSMLLILRVRYLSSYHCEVHQIQHVMLQNELSCISIPHNQFDKTPSTSSSNMVDQRQKDTSLHEVNICNTVVIGTHKPSVEIISFLPDGGSRVLGVGTISITNTMGTAIGGCVPQDVRLVFVDHLYVLSGLRNGMLLRFEWPASCKISSSISSSGNLGASTLMFMDNPVHLQLIAVRRIGITPTFLIPLSDSLDADIIALSDRPWLLQTARHSLSYISISFQPSTHVTPVSTAECTQGVLFVAENSLNLVEMVQTKRLNVQKFHLGGTPRKVLYHSDSKLLVVLRTDLGHDSCSSDICCVDPICGLVLSSFRLNAGETGKSMELVRVGSELVLVIGTSISAGPAIMPSGEAESTKGRLVVLCLEHMQQSDTASMTYSSKAGSPSQRASPFRETVGYAAEQLSGSSLSSSPDDNYSEGIKLENSEAWHLRLACSTIWPGMVLALCPYLDRYFLASAGNAFYVCGFPNDNCQRVRRLAVGRTRFMIMTLTAHFTRIAVGDCRDGILFFTYHEDSRKLEQVYCDPVQRLVADCVLMDVDTAVVSDRKGSLTVLSCSNHLEDSASPECNLTRSCSFYMGEIAMSLKKGSFSYKLPVDDIMKGCDVANSIADLSHNSIIASTLLGSIFVFIPLLREEYDVLEAVQARLVVHPLTQPILGNDHNEFRSRECSAGVAKILDGDMLAQFLELTRMQQEVVLALPLESPDTVMFTPKSSPPPPVTVNQVVRLLERIHNALN